jgi:hypothetical protein
LLPRAWSGDFDRFLSGSIPIMEAYLRSVLSGMLPGLNRSEPVCTPTPSPCLQNTYFQGDSDFVAQIPERVGVMRKVVRRKELWVRSGDL